MGKYTGAIIAAALGAAISSTFATTASAQAFMQSGGLTTQPIGHYEYCQRNPRECAKGTAPSRPAELTRKLWATLIDINNRVNTAIRPRTDMEIWGVEEYWSMPVNGVGDCEDYALMKQRMLVKAGVETGNLMIAVVRQRNGDGHAVLTVRTSMGDFILDNLEPRVLAWHETEYQYLKHQSQRNPGAWVSVSDDRHMLVGSVKKN